MKIDRASARQVYADPNQTILEHMYTGRAIVYSRYWRAGSFQVARLERRVSRARGGKTEAVEIILGNFGPHVWQGMFGRRSRLGLKALRNAILVHSRTSGQRQRYRIQGVLAGRFRSLKPQAHEPVFDTVAFKEVPSRLWRAQGALFDCQRQWSGRMTKAMRDEVRLLVELCRRAAA